MTDGVTMMQIMMIDDELFNNNQLLIIDEAMDDKLIAFRIIITESERESWILWTEDGSMIGLMDGQSLKRKLDEIQMVMANCGV